MGNQPVTIEILCYCAHEDEAHLRKLKAHLSSLQQQGQVSIWHEQDIALGTDRGEAIEAHLFAASLILFLVSSDFLAAYKVEIEQAMQRHKAGLVRVLPVLVRPCDWQHSPFALLQCLPLDHKPVTAWPDEDSAWNDIVAGIRRAIKNLPKPSVPRTTLPSVWNIPYPRNSIFTGREPILQRIADALEAGQATALSQPQAISGLGGIGKTQIALEYAYRHRQNYQAVLWTQADTRESLVSGYMTIAEALGLEHQGEQDQAVIIQAVKAWLEMHSSWLLILDNADELALVREFIPSTFGGHILLTTRAQSMGRLAERIEVETMTQDVGALFLLRRAGRATEKASLDSTSSSDIVIARSICDELGGLPLALDQAGAFIEETQCGLLDYQRRYRTRRTLLLKRRGGLVTDHPEPVATTWSLSFEKIEQKSPIAADLLRLCAFLHPDAIPVELITERASHLDPTFAPVSEDDITLDEAIATLGAYSLVRRNTEEKTLSVHRLVQAVLQDTMDSETRHLWAKRTVQVVNDAFPWVEFTVWLQCERYLSHALVCASFVEQEQISSKEAARLLHNAGSYLIQRGRALEAQPLLQQALTMREQHLGPEHTATGNTVGRLARCLRDQGKYAEAEPLYRRALSIDERQLGTDHPSTAISLNNLAYLYNIQGKYDEAEPMHKRAIKIFERQLEADNLYTATSLDNLAGLYRDQGKYAKAEPLLKRALEIREKQLGADHPFTATSFNNLAELYRAQGKHTEAETVLKRAIEIRKRLLGADHPNTARSLYNLALLYKTQGKYTEAEPLFQRALSIFEQVLGADHPDAQRIRADYAYFQRKRSGDTS